MAEQQYFKECKSPTPVSSLYLRFAYLKFSLSSLYSLVAVPSSKAAMPTLESTLLLAPLEIRNEIYALLIPNQFHTSLQGEAFCLARCIEPRQDNDESKSRHIVHDPLNALLRDESNYCIRADNASTPLWAARLKSTWGPHWGCKEAAVDRSSENYSSVSLLLVCRRVYVYNSYLGFFLHLLT